MALTGLTAVTVSAPLDIELGVTPELDGLDDDEIAGETTVTSGTSSGLKYSIMTGAENK